MMRLKLVKTADENHAAAANGVADESPQLEPKTIPHSAAILSELVLPCWIHTDRIVCADSYFALVPVAKLMNCNGTMRLFDRRREDCYSKFPMRYLASVELNHHHGDRKGLVSNAGRQAGDPSMFAFAWMDCWRRYFIAAASSLEAPGTPYNSWR